MTRTAPQSTYRLQITSSFDLFAAAKVLPYLHDLGADWVYLSPLLEAEPGSDHGYDVVSHERVDPARGGAEGLAALSAEARRLGLGVLVDIVPNHMGVATPSANAWWWDVLRLGRDSRYAPAFDVDWDAGDGRLLIPVVGDDDEGAIAVDRSAGELRYHENRYPLAPGTSRHDQQHYRLVSWRWADDRLNYRRFFAVNTLAAIRVEERSVFDASHVEIRRWFDEHLVDGLRVDHPDGLRDPAGYLRHLAGITDGAYVLVEKILALRDASSLGSSGTTLRDASSLGSSGTTMVEELEPWATAGTTGYDALALVDRVLTDGDGVAALPGAVDWTSLTHDTKRAVADGILGSEVHRLVRELPDGVVARPRGGLVGRLRRGRTEGLPVEVVTDAMAELVACFDVYRTYLPDGREHLDAALADARERRPDLAEALDALAPVLADPAQPSAARLQQTSGMVMAKGVEDCAFYRFTQLTSLTEVGADPSVLSVSAEQWHEAMAVRQRDWPHAMTTLSTHDTKRGEDVRARIAVLAEVPEAWTTALGRLLELVPLPDPAFGSLLWQAILGAWSDDERLRDRLHGYAEKAMREAGDRTTWTAPDADYEAAVHRAVDAAFDVPEVGQVLAGLLDVVTEPGWSNALSAKLLALAMPGVPDVYQGSELWEQSLVDPDNRRPVDFDLRAALLADPRLPHPARGKLAVTSAVLRARRERPELFASYAPAEVEGAAARHAVAFDRGGAVAVATRLPVALAAAGGWGDTELVLPAGRWWDEVTMRDVESDGRVFLAELLDEYPVALLTRDPEEA